MNVNTTVTCIFIYHIHPIQLKVGDRVQTKWEDNKSYLGHILRIQNGEFKKLVI